MLNRVGITKLILFSLFIVLARPPQPDAMECIAHVRFDPGRDYLVSGELGASANDSDPHPRRRLASVEVGPFGIRGRALCENTANNSTYLSAPRTYGKFTLTEVVFSSAQNDPVAVSMNLDLDGGFNLLDQTGKYALGKIVISAIINGTTFPGEIHVCTMYCNEVQIGLLEGIMGRWYHDVRLTTPQVVVPVNEPVTVTISMNIIISVDQFPWASGEGLFNNTFTFARTGPVFNVPDGVNVNSEQSIIVDNAYHSGNSVPAIPTTWGAIKALYH
jgi:hypothetical protein